MKALIYSTFAPAAAQFASLAASSGVKVQAIVTPRPDLKAGSRITSPEDFIVKAPNGADVCFAAGPESLRDIAAAYKPDIGICVIYSWMIPREAIALHRFGIINAHASLLPALRGPYPVAWAIRNGDAELGMTIHYLGEETDAGPILAQCSRPLPADTSPASMQPIFSSMNEEVLPAALGRALKGYPGCPQGAALGPWAGRFGSDYMNIDWTRPAEEICRQVKAWEWMPAGPAGKGPVAEVSGRSIRALAMSLERPADNTGLKVDTGTGPAWITSYEIL